jgi:serine/threonine protein kinase
MSIPGYLAMTVGEDFEIPSIRDEKGSGGTASVFMGRLKGSFLNRYANEIGNGRVAVKAFTVDEETTGEGESSFKYEIALMTYFKDHPNVVKFVGYCEKPRLIIMKYYETNLATVLKDKNVSIEPEVVSKIAYDIACGLDHIHSCGILHLDVKPGKLRILSILLYH